jgi:hypothetical protein
MDGKNWTAIGTVVASGNSNRLVRYYFNDGHPGIGANYYQLLQHDRGGRTEKSKIVSAEMTSQASKFSVYPNPVVNDIMNVVLSEHAHVELYSSAGVLVFSKDLETDTQQLDVSFLSKGYYYLKAGTAVLPVAIQ